MSVVLTRRSYITYTRPNYGISLNILPRLKLPKCETPFLTRQIHLFKPLTPEVPLLLSTRNIVVPYKRTRYVYSSSSGWAKYSLSLGFRSLGGWLTSRVVSKGHR